MSGEHEDCIEIRMTIQTEWGPFVGATLIHRSVIDKYPDAASRLVGRMMVALNDRADKGPSSLKEDMSIVEAGDSWRKGCR